MELEAVKKMKKSSTNEMLHVWSEQGKILGWGFGVWCISNVPAIDQAWFPPIEKHHHPYSAVLFHISTLRKDVLGMSVFAYYANKLPGGKCISAFCGDSFFQLSLH